MRTLRSLRAQVERLPAHPGAAIGRAESPADPVETRREPLRTLITAALLSLGLLAGTAHAADPQADCEAKAAERKLAGAAKNSFVKKCVTDAGGVVANDVQAMCEKSAADKKLAGAAKTSHVKKCVADATAASASSPAKKP
jgi:hypothetical protein